MHKIHNEPGPGSRPETTGVTLHHTSQYDLCAFFLGTGVNRPNSRMIVEMSNIKPGDKVLDVGCGTGSLTLTAERTAGASGSVYGIDTSPEMIAAAREKAESSGSRVVFEVGLIEKIAYLDASFDVVINRLVMHHLPDDVKRQGLEEIFRVLKPGGRLFLADFNPPANPLLAHAASALVGHRMMMQSNVEVLPPLLAEAGFVDIVSGPTRSAFLAFVSGKKPTA